MRIKYRNPPINELVIGVYFKEPIISLRSEHVGIYWATIKDEFPKSTQHLTIGNVDMQVPNEIFPMPRFWFATEDEVYLIQIQRNAFIFNWRRQSEGYPHYEDLKKLFDKKFLQFESFCKEEFKLTKIDIERCELAYINIISDEKYFHSFNDIQNIIPSFIPLLFDGKAKDCTRFNLSYDYSLEQDITLTVNLQTRRHKKTNKDALYFELKSSGALSQFSKSEADSWFDRAHVVIGNAFNGLTSHDVQHQHWQPKED